MNLFHEHRLLSLLIQDINRQRLAAGASPVTSAANPNPVGTHGNIASSTGTPTSVPTGTSGFGYDGRNDPTGGLPFGAGSVSVPTPPRGNENPQDTAVNATPENVRPQGNGQNGMAPESNADYQAYLSGLEQRKAFKLQQQYYQSLMDKMNQQGNAGTDASTQSTNPLKTAFSTSGQTDVASPSNPETNGNVFQNMTRGATTGSVQDKPTFASASQMEAIAAKRAQERQGQTGTTPPQPGTATTPPSSQKPTQGTTGGASSTSSTTTGSPTTPSGSTPSGTSGTQTNSNPFYTSADATSGQLNQIKQVFQQYPQFSDIFSMGLNALAGMHDATAKGDLVGFYQQLALLPDVNTSMPGFPGGLTQFGPQRLAQLQGQIMDERHTAFAAYQTSLGVAEMNKAMTQVAANKAAVDNATQYSVQHMQNIQREIGNRTALTNMGVVGTTSTAGLDWTQRNIDQGNELLNQISMDGQAIQQGYTIQMTQGYQNAINQASVSWMGANNAAAKEYNDGYNQLFNTVNMDFTQKADEHEKLLGDLISNQHSNDMAYAGSVGSAYAGLRQDYVSMQQNNVNKTFAQAQREVVDSQKFYNMRDQVLNGTVNMLKTNPGIQQGFQELLPLSITQEMVTIYNDPTSSPGEKAFASARLVEVGQKIFNPESSRLISGQIAMPLVFQSAFDQLRSLWGQGVSGDKLTPEMIQGFSHLGDQVMNFYSSLNDTQLAGALLNIDHWNSSVPEMTSRMRANPAFGGENLDPTLFTIDPNIVSSQFSGLGSGGAGGGGGGGGLTYTPYASGTAQGPPYGAQTGGPATYIPGLGYIPH